MPKPKASKLQAIRIKAVSKTLAAYQEFKDGSIDPYEPVTSVIVDLLADLHTFCLAHGFNYGDLQRIARNHATTEFLTPEGD